MAYRRIMGLIEGMRTITCPKCNNDFSVTISNAIDEHGEVYMCPHCGWKLRYVEEY